MADTATPEASDSPKLSAEKDRSCPFCGTKFTSSSLGRHLDLYIKPRNPKAPDGIHNVEEIRRLRGNVTRRQAKLSTSKREGSTPSSSRPDSLRGQRSPSTSAPSLPKSQQNGGLGQFGINKPNWTNTGVINDIPIATANRVGEHGAPRISSRRVSVKEEIDRKHSEMDARDRARAAELALRDVLGNIKAANMRAHPQSPFDFNLFGLSFPALCLRCLSTPPAISFGSRVPKERSWSIEPPSSYHLEALQRWRETKLRDWRIRRRALGMGRSMDETETNGHDSHNRPWLFSDPEADEHEAACTEHINASYDRWDCLPAKQRQEEWHKECVIALTQEQDRHRDTRERVERLEAQVHSLRAELDTRDGHDAASTSLPLSPTTALETYNAGHGSTMWNYDALIAKWRTRVENERSQQRPLPTTPWSVATPGVAHTPSYTNGKIRLTRPEQEAASDQLTSHGSNGIDDDEDLADAPGEDDESAMQMDQQLLDPDLRERTRNGAAIEGNRNTEEKG